MEHEVTIPELKAVFNKIIAKLESELGKDGKIGLKTSAYRLIPTEKWNEFEKPEDWFSAAEIELGDLIDDLHQLKKLIDSLERPCTYVDFERTASVLREISQLRNPL